MADGIEIVYQKKRQKHWDNTARLMHTWKGWGGYYQRRLAKIYAQMIPPGQRVLELGCGSGDLLAALQPRVGVGVDLSEEMVKQAGIRHPKLQFIQSDVHDLQLDTEFDYVILSDLVNDLYDVQRVFENLRKFTNPHARVIINLYSRLWELPLSLAEKMGLAKPNLLQNWLTVSDLTNLLNLTDFEVIRSWQEILLPVGIPLLDTIANRYLIRLWPFKTFAFTNFVIARPRIEQGAVTTQGHSVSVIVPARNEAGNISELFKRTPEMGSGTEIIFIEGHSKDNTWEAIQKAQLAFPERRSLLLKQTGTGKGDAVRAGFARASGDILMILDADLTVPPETLPRFFDALCYGKGEFANGVRLVYPIEDEAMRFINLLGNKFFSLAFSWLLGQPIKDTLCGTKVLWKKDYETIAQNRGYFGDFDPFGDFDLLFGASKLNLKIVDVPIRYQARSYGTTNIQRWKHGWLLIRMVLFAANRIKFI